MHSDDHTTPSDATSGAAAEPRPITRRTALRAAGAVGAAAATGAAFAPVRDATAQAQAERAPDAARRFAGRVVLVTGATSGIGRTTAERFAAEGARVVFCGRREALGEEVEAGIRRAGGEATYVRADVRREADVRALVDACVARYGALHVAFNNAGVEAPRNAPLGEQRADDYADVMQTNAFGVFYSLRYELPVLAANAPRGAFDTRGVVINNASVSGHVGFAGISPYAASKHAIVGLTRCAALEYGPRGVRVNAVAPGGVDTPMRRRAYAAQNYTGPQPAPMPNLPRRANTAGEIADVVLFLASDAASSLQGTDVDVTGGMLTGAHLAPTRA